MADEPWGAAIEGTFVKVQRSADGLALRVSMMAATDVPIILQEAILARVESMFTSAARSLEEAAVAADDYDAALAAAIRALG